MATKEQEKLAQYVRECYDWSSDFISAQHQKFVDRYRQFRQVWPQGFGTKSHLFIPKTTALVLNVVPRLLGDDPTIKVQAIGNTPTGNARAQEAAIQYETERMDYFMRLYFQVMDASIYGIGLRQNIWWTQTEAIRRRLKPFEIEDFNEKEQKVPPFMMDIHMVYDGPWSNEIDVFDWYPDPAHTRSIDADFCVMTDRMSPMEMRSLEETRFMRGVGAFLDKIRGSNVHSGMEERPAEAMKIQRDATSGYDHGRRFIDKAPFDLKPVNLIDFWGKVPIDLVPKKIRESIASNARRSGISVAPKWVKMNVVQAMDNSIFHAAPFPYFHNEIPVVESHLMPLKGEHVGLGLVEMVSDLQDHENYRRNIMIDNINRVGNGMYTKLRSSRIRDHDLVSRAGGAITVDRHDELRVLENPMSQILPAAFQEIQLGEQEWQEISGFSLFSQGRDAPGLNKTASGIAMLIREANNRLNLIKLISERQTLTADGHQFIAMNKQFITDPVRLRLIGQEEPVDLGPGTLWGDFDVAPRITPKEPFNVAVNRENFVFLYQLLMGSPNAGNYDFSALDEQAMKLFDQEALVDEVLSPEQSNVLGLVAQGAARTPGAVQGANNSLQGGQLQSLARSIAA